MKKSDVRLKIGRRKNSARSLPASQEAVNGTPNHPDFLIRLVGLRRLQAAAHEPRPRHRRD